MDQKRATIKDIATEVGVSARTVSMVLNNQGRISQSTRERVIEVAKRLNYQPNILARGLVNQRTYLIGVVVPYLTSSFFTTIMSGIEERCMDQGYDIILGNSSSGPTSEKDAIQRMVNRKVDGIICAPDPRYFEFYQGLLDTGLPIVEIMTHVKGSSAVSVLVDDVQGGYLAGRHLLDLGHRKIGFVSYVEEFYEEIRLRREGLRNALLEQGVPVNREPYETSSDLTPEGTRSAVRELLSRAPDMTALLVPTDMAAIGAIRACIDSGRRVPEDISVVGYDDIDVARYQIQYQLTTVSQPKEQVGRIAFDIIHALIEKSGPSDGVVLQPSLVVRSTTAAVRTEDAAQS